MSNDTPVTLAGADVLLSRPAEYWDAHTPPFFDDARATWHVFAYADVARVLTEDASYSYEWGFSGDHPNYHVMWAFDDPRHHDLRAIVADPFRHGELARLEASIRALADELVDAIIDAGTGRFEIMSEFADDYVIRVICLVMGVELADAALFQAWAHEAAAAASLGTLPAQVDMRAYLADLLEQRRREPQAGLVDELIAAQQRGHLVAGEPLNDRDLIGYLWGLLAAGVNTTATSIANLMLLLSAYGLLDEVRDEPALRRSAIEESLRWYPSFPSVLVRARHDVRLGKATAAAGDLVTGWLTSANRDPDRFPEPHVFDIRRSPNPHVGFGRGDRNCLGAPLARLEIRIALDALLERLPGLRWHRELPFQRIHGLVDRVEQAHFAFDARAA